MTYSYKEEAKITNTDTSATEMAHSVGVSAGGTFGKEGVASVGVQLSYSFTHTTS